MTFGIDTSRWQLGLDMVAAAREGVEFNIVKAVASDQAALARAAGSQSHVDRTRAARLPGLGHYTIPNSQNTPDATAAFTVKNLYRYQRGQVIGLDNEPLDSFPVFWTDPVAEAFFRRLMAEGIPQDRMWLYCPADLTRRSGGFPLCEALGVRIWWAAYGNLPTGRTPDHAPNTQGSVSTVHVHQFTSRAAVAGAAVDGNHSPIPLAGLFGTSEGGGMPRTLAGVIAWARAHANDMNWAGWCEKFINNAGAFNQTFSSALNAGSNSGPLRGDWQNAPAGAIHYWAGAGGFGHDAFDLYGGGSTLLMASSAVTDDWGTNLGTISFLNYARLGLPYRGWTMRHGTETLNLAGGGSTAGGGTIPIGDDMPSEAWLNGLGSSIIQQVNAHTATLIAAATERGVDATRRDNRGRLMFDAGPLGDQPLAKAKLAVVGAIGRIEVLPEDPEVRNAAADGIREQAGLMVPKGEAWQPTNTTAFFRVVDWWNDPTHPLGEFVENTFELDEGPTLMVRSDREVSYPTRQHVWKDGRPVRITKGGKTVERFAIVNRAAVAVLVDGSTVALDAEDILRANAQRIDGQVWGTL